MFHCINTDKSTRSAETGLAVHGHGTRTWFGEVFFAGSDERVDDALGRDRTVHEDHVFVLDSLVDETAFVILRVVESHNLRHLQVLEDVHVAGS